MTDHGHDDTGGKGPKVLNLVPGGGTTNEQKAALAKFTANVPLYIEAAQANARILHAKYRALVDEGFSEQQALLICLQTPLL